MNKRAVGPRDAGLPQQPLARMALALAFVPLLMLPIRADGQDIAAPQAAPVPPAAAHGLTYADLVDLTQPAQLVIRAVIRHQATVEPERSPGLRPGFVRLYLEAAPVGTLVGRLPPVEAVHYLADVPLTAEGKAPNLKKQEVLLFAHAPSGDAATPPPGAPPAKAMDIQLVAPDAQLAWDAGVESKVAAIYTELATPGTPGPVGRVREAIYEPGTLAGQGETQIFLTMADGAPASISVEHTPDHAVNWSVSFGEVVNPSGHPPAPATLTWYRLACGLPHDLPPGVNLSEGDGDKAQAEADYRIVLAQLGPCARNRI